MNANYRKATNAAYDILAKCPKLSLSADVQYIAENMIPGCKLLSYGQANVIFGYDIDLLKATSEYGFSIVNKDRRVIFYNNDAVEGCVRFTLAHEIGHAVLKHDEEDNEQFEREANCFARNLLCPAPIVYGLGLETVRDYTQVFSVSKKMAEVAIGYYQTDKMLINQSSWSYMQDALYAYMMGFDTIDGFYQYMAS